MKGWVSFVRVSAVDPVVLHALIKGQFVNTGFYTHKHTYFGEQTLAFLSSLLDPFRLQTATNQHDLVGVSTMVVPNLQAKTTIERQAIQQK